MSAADVETRPMLLTGLEATTAMTHDIARELVCTRVCATFYAYAGLEFTSMALYSTWDRCAVGCRLWNEYLGWEKTEACLDHSNRSNTLDIQEQ